MDKSIWIVVVRWQQGEYTSQEYVFLVRAEDASSAVMYAIVTASEKHDNSRSEWESISCQKLVEVLEDTSECIMIYDAFYDG